MNRSQGYNEKMKKDKINNNIDFKLLAGQKLMVGFEGTELNSDLEFLISELKIGGLVLFTRNIKSPEWQTSLVLEIEPIIDFKNLEYVLIITGEK